MQNNSRPLQSYSPSLRYKQGLSRAHVHGLKHAYRTLGLKYAAYQGQYDDEETTGTPYPTKSKTIHAERLADILQQEDTEITRPSPDNTHRSKWNKPITWSAPVNLAGLDEGLPVSGIIAPANPRS